MKKLLKLLFHDEIINYEIKYKQIIEKIQKDNSIKINEIERESKKKYEQYTLFKRIFDIDKDSKIVGMKFNKNNEEVIITEWTTNSNLWVKLYGKSYQGITHLPRIMGSLKEQNNMERHKYVEIDDIINIHNNIENGSIMMEHYIKLAKSLDAKYITGWLSEVDKDHFDRSEHFYKKFGFKVTYNEDKTSGSIKLIL